MRDESVAEKLIHSSDGIQNLGNQLFDSKMSKQKLKNISHIVSDILSNTTECFDYCARDIFELHILPSNPSEKDANVYFPFSIDQLNKKPFSLLQQSQPALYNFLINFAADADSKKLLNDTLISSGIFRKIRKLVNEKKHDNVIVVNTEGGAELVSEFGGFKVVFPLRQIGVTETKIDHDSMRGPMIISNAYELKDTSEEVMTLCQMNLSGTKIVLQNIYNSFLGSSIVFK